MRSEIIGS